MNYAVKLNEKALSFIYSVIRGHSIDGWKLISDTWYYYKNSNKQTGWQSINGKWYYLETSGSMSTGWKYVRGRWYYLDKTNGDMKTVTVTTTNNTNNAGVINLPTLEIMVFGFSMNNMAIMLKTTAKIR